MIKKDKEAFVEAVMQISASQALYQASVGLPEYH